MHPLQTKFERVIRSGEVIPDALWGEKVNAVNVQAAVPNSPQIETIRDALRSVSGGELLEIPSDTTHISVLRVVAARTDYGAPRSEVWNRISEECIAGFRRVAANTPPFQVRFTDLVATDSAIMLVGQDGGQMDVLRDALKSVQSPLYSSLERGLS